MSERQETIADIIAEMRGQAGNDGYPLDIKHYSDRLEAAHKRERGDCAKLREALKLCMDEMCSRCRDLATARSNLLPCLQGCEPVRKAKAALAAPPRNCDLTKVTEDPWRAWLDDKSNWDEFGSPKLEIHDWLVAPATEKEGGAK